MLDPEAKAAEPTENDGGTTAVLRDVPLADVPLTINDPTVANAAEPTENQGGTTK